MTIKSVLFPVDFSPSCRAMAPFVRRASNVYSTTVALLYVLEPFSEGFEPLVRPAPAIEEDRRKAANAKLHSFLESEFPPAESRRILVAGDPATCIAEIARKDAFDLIVMPTHAGIFRRTLIGSTTAKVLNDADCPVVTTQHAETITPRRVEHREVVCTLGLQPDSERVLRYAHQLAAAGHSNLTLLHALPQEELHLPQELSLERRVESAERQQALKRINELQRAVGSSAKVEIVGGPIKDSLIEAATRLGADLLIVGRGTEGGSRLRDLTYAMVRDAPCPVLSV